MGNTRPVRTNTADRAPNTLTTQGYVRILVCTVCFQWNLHTNPLHPSESYLVSSAVFFWIGTKIQKKNTQKNRRKNNYFWWSIFSYHLFVLDEICSKMPLLTTLYQCSWSDRMKPLPSKGPIVSLRTTAKRVAYMYERMSYSCMCILHIWHTYMTYIHDMYIHDMILHTCVYAGTD